MRKRQTRIAVLGGGTGQSTMLRGLKAHSDNITAIVTVTDDGGGSGVLRREMHMPPPGDIRNCIQALANTESAMQDMINYRFREGSLAGQSLGNLLLAALYDLSPSFDAFPMRRFRCRMLSLPWFRFPLPDLRPLLIHRTMIRCPLFLRFLPLVRFLRRFRRLPLRGSPSVPLRSRMIPPIRLAAQAQYCRCPARTHR